MIKSRWKCQRGVMRGMEVHVIGSGGREHAIGWAFWKAGFEVFYHPGNAGTKFHGKNAPFRDIEDVRSMDGIIIPGSETFLAKGIADLSEKVFGPVKSAAVLEASKAWAVSFARGNGLPVPRSEIVGSPDELEGVLKHFSPPYVIKADPLAGGKGVIIRESFDEALRDGTLLMEGKLLKGVSGKVVVQEFLKGKELSAMAVVSGRKFALLPFTRDYKRAFDQNKGPNTGGMGSWGPVKIPSSLKEKIEGIYDRTLFALEKEGLSYRGFLYIGLMIVEGEPFILEYNVRLGDPETEVIVTLDPEGFVQMVLAAFEGGDIPSMKPEGFAVDVVAASEGYPESPKKGQVIKIDDVEGYFFAGVKEEDGKMVVSGGRVIHCMGKGKSLEEARKEAYERVERVKFEVKFYRRDIAL